ncbi:MAG: FtsX-like permease family protein [Muribaculaceae bacterium]
MDRFTLKVALRYIVSKKSHSAVNIISIISVCGVAVTTIALVCVLSVFNGFSSLVESKLAQLDPELKIFSATGKVINNADSVVQVLKSVDVIEVCQPTIEDHALAIYGEEQMPVRLKGVSEKYDSLTNIRELVKNDGEYLLKDEFSDYALMSVGAAVSLKARPGFNTQLRLYAPRRKGRVNIANPMTAFRSDSLYVSGVYQVEQTEYDADMIIVPISVARQLLDYTTEATSIEIKLRENADKTVAFDQISKIVGTNYIVKDRLMQQETSFRLINIEKWITFLLLGFILIIATFNIISTLSVLIIEKDASINTFKSLGATDKQIAHIFVAEGWIISLFGAVIGVVIGLVLCLVQQYFGIIKLSGDASAMIIDAYPVVVEVSDVAVIFGLVAIVGSLTSIATSMIMRHRLRRN